MRIEGREFSELQAAREALAAGKEVSVCIDGVPVQQAVSDLSALSGLRIGITSGDEKALVTLNAKDITLQDSLARLATQTGVHVTTK